MKAVLFQEKNLLALTEIEKPVATKDSVVVKVKYCGICGSDVHRFMDRDENLPEAMDELTKTSVPVRFVIKPEQ